MSREYLELPSRTAKPRATGVTMAIDDGIPLNYFTDLIEGAGEYIDFVKFGWGTSVISKNLKDKMSVLANEGVHYYFGGTLFEKYVLQGRFDEFRQMCQGYDANYVEVSNGTIDLSDDAKAVYVNELSRDFHVISEVGSKDQIKSEHMAPYKWVSYINQDLEAGAILVTLETRSSGHGGICRPNGELRIGLIEEILTSGIDVDSLLFEAPSTTLQGFFVTRVGVNVNLGNIALDDVIGLETIRLGLRSETLRVFEGPGTVLLDEAV